MKKILIVNNNMHIGGVQKALVGLLWNIRAYYDVTLLLFYPGGAYLDQIPPDVKVVYAGGNYRYIGMTKNDTKTRREKIARSFFGGIARVFGRRYSIAIMGVGQKQLTGFDVAISYLHNSGTRSFYGGCNEFVLRHVQASKKVGFLHCDYLACGADNKQNTAIYGAFDVIAACSEGCAKSFLSCHPQWADRVKVVPNCHRFDQIRSGAELVPVKLPKQQVNILTVARLGQEKGVDRALRVIAHLQTTTPFLYHIIGDGAQEPLLRQMVEKEKLQDRVCFYGLLDNPYGYMQAADLLWIPSRSEAAPMVIGEAAFLGTPILSTKTSSAQDMIEQTGYGWVCENTEQGMQQMLQALLQDRAAIERAKQKMTQTKIDNHEAIAAFLSCVGGDYIDRKL